MAGAPEIAAGDELPILVGGSSTEDERLMLVGHPRDGRVLVREWSSTDWSKPPVTREHDAEALASHIERMRRGGRSVNQEPTAIRRWLQLAG